MFDHYMHLLVTLFWLLAAGLVSFILYMTCGEKDIDKHIDKHKYDYLIGQDANIAYNIIHSKLLKLYDAGEIPSFSVSKINQHYYNLSDGQSLAPYSYFILLDVKTNKVVAIDFME